MQRAVIALLLMGLGSGLGFVPAIAGTSKDFNLTCEPGDKGIWAPLDRSNHDNLVADSDRPKLVPGESFSLRLRWEWRDWEPGSDLDLRACTDLDGRQEADGKATSPHQGPQFDFKTVHPSHSPERRGGEKNRRVVTHTIKLQVPKDAPPGELCARVAVIGDPQAHRGSAPPFDIAGTVCVPVTAHTVPPGDSSPPHPEKPDSYPPCAEKPDSPKGGKPDSSPPCAEKPDSPHPEKPDSYPPCADKPDSPKGGKPDSSPPCAEKPDSPHPGKPDSPPCAEKPDSPRGGKPDSPRGGKPDSSPPCAEKPDSPHPGKPDSPPCVEKPDSPRGGKPDSPRGGKPDSSPPCAEKPDSPHPENPNSPPPCVGNPDSSPPHSGNPNSSPPCSGNPDSAPPHSGNPNSSPPHGGNPGPTVRTGPSAPPATLPVTGGPYARLVSLALGLLIVGFSLMSRASRNRKRTGGRSADTG